MNRLGTAATLLILSIAIVACQSPASPTPRAPALPTGIAVFPSPTPTAGLLPAGSGPTTTGEVPRMTPEDLRSLQTSARKVVVVDTRDRASYDRGHIPGALNIPTAEMETRYTELPRGTPIVLYCS